MLIQTPSIACGVLGQHVNLTGPLSGFAYLLALGLTAEVALDSQVMDKALPVLQFSAAEIVVPGNCQSRLTLRLGFLSGHDALRSVLGATIRTNVAVGILGEQSLGKLTSYSPKRAVILCLWYG